MTKPHENRQAEFSNDVDNGKLAEPTSSGSTFYIKLASNGTPVGYVGVKNGWCAVVDEGSALEFEAYVYDDVTYYKVASGSYAGKYLSVSKHDAVGLYRWHGATGWSKSGDDLVSKYNNQKLSMYSTDYEYLYAWNDYTVLSVSLPST
ncbi:MAG: hypothetical protein AAF799_37495 [Myxococcota bacterium]